MGSSIVQLDLDIRRTIEDCLKPCDEICLLEALDGIMSNAAHFQLLLDLRNRERVEILGHGRTTIVADTTRCRLLLLFGIVVALRLVCLAFAALARARLEVASEEIDVFGNLWVSIVGDVHVICEETHDDGSLYYFGDER